MYVLKQDKIVKDNIAKWMAQEGGAAREMRPDICSLNQWTSQDVFAGPYLDDPEERVEFTKVRLHVARACNAMHVCTESCKEVCE